MADNNKPNVYSESDIIPDNPLGPPTSGFGEATKDAAGTLLNDALNLPSNLWHMGGQMLSHPIDTTDRMLKAFQDMPDTFANEWMAGHPGAAVAHMAELAAPVAAERLPGLAGAVADSDVYQAIKGGARGAAREAIAPIDISRYGIKLPIPQAAAGWEAGHVLSRWLPEPFNYLGPVAGAGVPVVKGFISGAKEALAGAGSEEAELNALAREHFNKPFSELKGDDAATIQAVRNFQRNAAETSPAAGAAKTPRPVPTTNLRVRTRQEVMNEVNQNLNLGSQTPPDVQPAAPAGPGKTAADLLREEMAAKRAAQPQPPQQPPAPKRVGPPRKSPIVDANGRAIYSRSVQYPQQAVPEAAASGAAGSTSKANAVNAVNEQLNLKANVPEGTADVYKSQGGEAASTHIQSMQAKDAAIAKYLRENPKALAGKKWSELTDANRQSILQDINKATGKKYTYSPNTAARTGEIDRLLGH